MFLQQLVLKVMLCFRFTDSMCFVEDKEQLIPGSALLLKVQTSSCWGDVFRMESLPQNKVKVQSPKSVRAIDLIHIILPYKPLMHI